MTQARRREGRHAVRAAKRRGAGFTLIELLVVMGVLVVLAVLTTVSFGRVTRDARLSSGTNAVISSFGTARALAMQTNNFVLCTFRAMPETAGSKRQVTEIVIAEWTGETQTFIDNGKTNLKDVFAPVPGYTPRRLGYGINVAGPRTDFGQDLFWITEPNLANAEVDRAFAIMFGPDGRLLTRRPDGAVTAQHLAFVDYDGDGQQDIGTTSGAARFWIYDEPGDESNLNFAQFVAVFDDADARERFDTTQWKGAANENARRAELTTYINEFSDRINFNWYSGVVAR